MLPVDSEHSALAQCLEGAAEGAVTGIVITASGGPFRGRSAEALAEVTVADALAHPTWSMGAKITIDSATLMNKGLEVIEAHHLFGIAYDDIEVVVHPQSIVHGMARFRDGALIAHVGHPDMRVPISWALTYPRRSATPVPALDLSRPLRLDFEPPDEGVFRCLALARQAGREGGTAPCVLNAANEVAVGAFLAGTVGFPDIADLVEHALERVPADPLESLEQVLDADRRAREAVTDAMRTAA
jgi:1-deoxy-D-xylulose-5-phosphate reductoisomerase